MCSSQWERTELFVVQSARPYSALILVFHHCGLVRKVG
jgi:hypothetical protein